MDYPILAFILIVSIVDWFAVNRNKKSLEYFFTPAVMVLWIVWLVQNGSLTNWMVCFVIGSIFSLIGDILLMLPFNLFILGLISFLLAHISYIVGINRSLPPVKPVGVIIFLVIIIIAWRIYRRLAQGMQVNKLHNLKLPVLFYSFVISIMTLSALLTLTQADWSFISAAFISGGAILFFISDTIIAWEKFISPISYGSLKTMVSYHLAQAGILIGAAMHYLT